MVNDNKAMLVYPAFASEFLKYFLHLKKKILTFFGRELFFFFSETHAQTLGNNNYLS